PKASPPPSTPGNATPRSSSSPTNLSSLIDSWTLFDNSGEVPYPIAKEIEQHLTVLDDQLFKRYFDMAIKPTDESLRETPEIPDWVSALTALRLAKAQVIEEHLKTGRPLIIWRDDRVHRQPPEEAKRELEAALKNDPWAAFTRESRVHKFRTY